MTGAARSTASLIRKIIAAVILVPLGVVIIAFAVANRQEVTLSLDPFASSPAPGWQTQPLFVIVVAALILGVLIGGIAAWLRQAKWRRAARRLEREVADLHVEIAALRRTAGTSSTIATAAAPERLQLRPPTA